MRIFDFFFASLPPFLFSLISRLVTCIPTQIEYENREVMTLFVHVISSSCNLKMVEYDRKGKKRKSL